MSPPKIFISATSDDLSSARQIAKEALLTINCHPVEQTNFEPDWRSVTDMLREKIGDCQALIHLVGFRYGAEPDPASLPDGTPRRSYTQMEYHLARGLGLRVYTFLLPETYPFDVPAKADTPEQTQLQAAHRTLIQSSPQIYDDHPTNDLDLRTRIIALQEQVISLVQEQQSIAKEVKTTRHWGLWAAATIVLILGGIGLWQWRGQSELASQVQVVTQKQDEQTSLLKDQSNLLREAVVQLEKLTEENARLGIKITDLPREAVEKELAARVGVSAVELRLNIEAGKKSQDALTRAHAYLLAGKLAEVHAAAKEVRDAEAPVIQRIIQSHRVDGQAYFQEIKYEAALESYQKAAALVDKAIDPLAWADAHILVTDKQMMLARYSDAEPLLQEVVRIRKLHLDSKAPKVADALNLLAELLRATNRPQEAKTKYEEALNTYVLAHGRNHPSVAIVLNNQALLHKAGDRMSKAEPLMEQALNIDKGYYGKDHPAVARDLNNLAMLMQATNRPVEAVTNMEDVLAIMEKLYGVNHPETLTVLNNLGHLYLVIKQPIKAETLLERALSVGAKAYGENHPQIGVTLNNLSQCYFATNRPEKAEPMMERVLSIMKTSYGENHPRFANALNNLAHLLQMTNRVPKAESYFRQALEIDEANYGLDHSDVARDLNNLARLLQATNRLTEAEPLMQRMVGIFLRFQAHNGHRHPHILAAVNNYLGLARQMKIADPDSHVRLDKLRQKAGLEAAVFEAIWQDAQAANSR